jgi:hypothetical protein
MKMGNETWKQIPGIEWYEASNFGNVRSIKGRNKVMQPKQNRNGYLEVHLRWLNNGIRFNKVISVHRLIAITFLKYKENTEVHHKNEVKTDNRADNLRWVSHSFNCRENLVKGSKICLSNKEVGEIRKLHKSKKFNQVQLAKKFKVNQCTISRVILKQVRWWI